MIMQVKHCTRIELENQTFNLVLLLKPLIKVLFLRSEQYWLSFDQLSIKYFKWSAKNFDHLCYLSFVITELEKKSGSGGKFFGIECDLDKDEDIQKMFDWIKNHPELGQIDVCICNAGIFLINTVE